ncbi:unnamed protein product [Calicophoron daubneyi]|uniref:Cadherin domain-containing protein n=1 Tax=Calicophoron daubneyi TaxID=300641 RepID=A0AAV2TJJ3_CALDB
MGLSCYILLSVQFYLPLLLLLHSTHGNKLSDDLRFFVTEEVPKGTIIASGSALGAIYLQSVTNGPRILNQRDPGISSLSFRFTPSDASASQAPTLHLVVTDRIDREAICPLTTTDMITDYEGLGMQRSSDFYISSNSVDLTSTFTNSQKSPSLTSTDCAISLRVATSFGDDQQLHQIYVYVQDINDNAPTWDKKTFQVTFRDGDPVGTKKPLPLAIDVDLGSNALITYRLEDTDRGGFDSARYTGRYNTKSESFRGTDMFELIKDREGSGNRLFIVNKHELDREAKPDGWNLLLIAANTEGPKLLTSQLQIQVNITDINDNAPEFSQLVYQPQLNNQKVGVVPENVPVGQKLVHLHAADADAGKNAAIRYGFAPSPKVDLLKHFFQINDNGDLVVRNRLDVDRKMSDSGSKQSLHLPTGFMTFDVQAVDGADSAYAKTGYATVKLKVEDVDDETPEIKVHSFNPCVNQSTTSDSVQTEAEVAVTENEPPGQLIGLIEVSDPDIHSRGMVRCILMGPNAGSFRLTQQDLTSNEYRLYTATKLDREEAARLIVTIECRDLAEHVTSTSVGVNVLDVNDHAPKFEESVYHYTILEDDGESEESRRNTNGRRSWVTPDGRAFVKAVDLDSGQNQRVEYYLQNGGDESADNRFAVDKNTGELLALGPFDRESIPTHRITILAVDGGHPPHSGSCTVQVTVADVNDNPPLFSPQTSVTGGYTFSVLENQLPGTKIGQVEAYDPDLLPSPSLDIAQGILPVGNLKPGEKSSSAGKERLTFSLKNEKDAQAFWIDPKSGVIITRAVLDREVQSTYAFHVTVRDGPNSPLHQTGRPSSLPSLSADNRSHMVSIMVTVTVEDENDNEPTFIRPNSTNHMVLLDPAAIPGQSLLQLLAVDPDEGLNGQVSYAIRGGNAGNLFNVDPRTGLLYLENQIPRRTIAEATAAAAANSASSDQYHTERGNANDADSSKSLKHPAIHPTYLLAIEACDHGEPRRCTNFPNLQIQLRVPTDVDEKSLNHLLFADENMGGRSHMDSLGDAMALGSRDNGTNGLSLAEIIIITLSVFFALLIIAIVTTICVLQRRTQGIAQNRVQKDPAVMKRVGVGPMNTVEMLDQTKALRLAGDKGCPTPIRTRQLDIDGSNPSLQDEINGLSYDALSHTNMHLARSPSGPVSPNMSAFPYPTDHPAMPRMYSRAPVSIDYGVFSPAFVSNTMALADNYQTLEEWNDSRFTSRPMDIDSDRAMRPVAGYYTQQRPIIQTNPRWENYPTQSVVEATDSKKGGDVFDLIAPISGSPTEDLTQETKRSAFSPASSFSPQSQRSTKKTLQSYGGFPKASFV